MLILSTLLGFFGPFIPEIIKLFRDRGDQKHELAILKLQAEAAKEQHLQKIEEINLRGDIAESNAIRAPQQSFGVQLLDAAKSHSMHALWWLPVFWLFAFLDFLNGTVRPVVAYWVVGFWMLHRWAVVQAFQADGASLAEAASKAWSPDDTAVLFLVLGYFFGQRAVKAAFGGSTGTGRPGGG